MTNEQLKRFNKVKKQIIDKEVYQYLKDILQNLYIEILNKYEGNTLYLMQRELLEGWCWQTTESTIIFFKDTDYICRGNLIFDKNTTYYHAWICFNYNNKEYVFDPCLNILCKKKLFDKVFQVDIKAKIPAKKVKEELIFLLKKPKSKKSTLDCSKNCHNFMNYFLEKYTEKKEDEIFITGNGQDDINYPMYRNYTGYTAQIENNNIKSLKAHYYQRLY